MEDQGKEAHVNVKGKRPCVDLDQSFVEYSSSASATASGTNAEVTGGSIFKILADRKAFKCPRERDLVISASATTGTKAQVKGKRPRVENPSSASATSGTNDEVTGRRIFKPLSLYMHPLAYGLDPSEIRFEFHLEEGRVVTKVKELRPRRKCPKKSVPPGPENLPKQQLRRAAYLKEEEIPAAIRKKGYLYTR